jgi:HTH-type transcriptional repressor of NAD biosynthesis genes
VSHGLVIGKFYPPHRGHHGLVRQAAGEVDRLSVVVMGSSAESIPAEERAEWMRAEHAGENNVTIAVVNCDAPVDIDDANVWRAQVAAIEAGTRSCNTDPVDVLFSCEVYGDELASRIGARHRLCERTDWLSATAVRSDPLGRWNDLAPRTRAALVMRVVVVGAESSGTTSISKALADHYRALGGVWEKTELVPEYGRDFTLENWQRDRTEAAAAGCRQPLLDEIVWDATDFDAAARRQTEMEERAAASGSPVLFCDTDAFATAIWERRYLGARAREHPEYAQAPALPRRDVYLVTDHEGVPWDDGAMREGDLQARSAMTRWFIDSLTAAGHSWVLLSGTEPERVALALRAIAPLVERRLTFADPRMGPGFGPTPSRPPEK